jgi:hypothetical protein
MAASTLAHASSVLVWGSMAILKGLPKISGRGGDEALEGPGSVEVVLLLALGLGAAPSVEGATLAPAGAAGVAEGASGALVVLAVEGAAGAAPVVSGVPPALGARSCRELVRLPQWTVHLRTHGSLLLWRRVAVSPVWR